MPDQAPDVVVFDGPNALRGLTSLLAQLGHQVRRLPGDAPPEPEGRVSAGTVAVLYCAAADDGRAARIAKRLRNVAAVIVVAESGDFGRYLELTRAGAAFYYELAEGESAIADGIDRITRVNSPRLG